MPGSPIRSRRLMCRTRMPPIRPESDVPASTFGPAGPASFLRFARRSEAVVGKEGGSRTRSNAADVVLRSDPRHFGDHREKRGSMALPKKTNCWRGRRRAPGGERRRGPCVASQWVSSSTAGRSRQPQTPRTALLDAVGAFSNLWTYWQPPYWLPWRSPRVPPTPRKSPCSVRGFRTCTSTSGRPRRSKTSRLR